ncbi:MAG TPA: hypothetical protein VFI77_01835 [Gemmatimonadales bacterium]|nr:hypothetical protein [Gemmatimonadales bacterium]
MTPIRLLLPLAWLAAACGQSTDRAAGQDSAPRDSPPAGRPESLPPKYWEPRPIQRPKVKVLPPVPDPKPDSGSIPDSGGTSAAPADTADSARHAMAVAGRARGGHRGFQITPADSARWPVPGLPEPLPGSLIPANRIVAYYGTPRSTRMGVLGRIPPDSMLPRLERTARLWAEADSSRGVMPALHLIATVAQDKPVGGGKYRLRLGTAVIDSVMQWAETRGWIAILDIQIGHSTVAAELEPLLPYLRRPYVHLALDPEFAMKNGGVPGRRIGTLDASDVNTAVDVLTKLVDEEKIPPKVLVVHRFTRRMLTNVERIKVDPRVQVVIDMDGFGIRQHKEDAYRFWIVPYPVQYTGFKLFYKNDRKPAFRGETAPWTCPDSVALAVGCGDDGLMTPEQVLGLYPRPDYIQYQ